ncbi:MAG: GNAT family N-acetyltransferase [Flavobacteriaceae bacterium]
MIKIITANATHVNVISEIGKETFLDAHGHSAPKTELDIYTQTTYSLQAVADDLNHPQNIYHILYYNDEIAGYSKIKLNTPFNHKTPENSTKLDRIYFLKKFYGLGLAKTLLNHNINWAKNHNQHGIWLAVWVNNLRAIKFYSKVGFEIVGEYDFNISKTHSNPNHIMYLNI